MHPFPGCHKPARESRLLKLAHHCQCVFRRRRRKRPTRNTVMVEIWVGGKIGGKSHQNWLVKWLTAPVYMVNLDGGKWGKIPSKMVDDLFPYHCLQKKPRFAQGLKVFRFPTKCFNKSSTRKCLILWKISKKWRISNRCFLGMCLSSKIQAFQTKIKLKFKLLLGFFELEKLEKLEFRAWTHPPLVCTLFTAAIFF